jgi:hypothetical protein
MLFSVGKHSPKDRPDAIFSLSHVKNVVGDEGNYRHPSKPLKRRRDFLLWQSPDCILALFKTSKLGEGTKKQRQNTSK